MIRGSNQKFLTKTILFCFGLFQFFFRQGSKNSLYATLENLKPEKRASFLAYVGIEGDSLPHPSVVDDYLALLDPEEVNRILMDLFISCQKDKLFYNHAEKLLPNNSFHLGMDGFWTHHYQNPHAADEAGNNVCPYCLPRVHHKGTAEEYTTWVHAFVTFVMVFPGGLTLPIYIYPLKSEQVNTASQDNDFKQECELTAAHAVLVKIRERLPRISITFLGDSLYANHPFIKLCEKLFIDYLIVRKEKTLPTIGKKCDELATTELYTKHYKHKQKTKSGKTSIEKECCWFNHVHLAEDTYTNVLRFVETSFASGSDPSTYRNEWLCSRKINIGNCFSLPAHGRLRWDHEDMHNSLKNRGFDASHDYARKNPNLWLIWKLLMFVGFLIFELFSFTQLAYDAKGLRSWMKFAKDLLEQLVNLLWSDISLSRCLQKVKIQFRYRFDTS